MFLDEPVAFGDLEALENQMEQCSIMAADIQATVTERVSLAVSHGKEIVEILDWIDGDNRSNYEEQRKMIKDKIASFKKSWSEVSAAASEKQVKIDEAISATKTLLQLFSRLETKLNQLTSSSRQESDYEDLVSEVKEDLERVSSELDRVENENKPLSASIEEMIKKRDLIKRQVEQLVSVQESKEDPPEIPKHGLNKESASLLVYENLDRRIKEEEKEDEEVFHVGVSSVLVFRCIKF